MTIENYIAFIIGIFLGFMLGIVTISFFKVNER